jgi:putative nucleotide binding protein
VEVFMSLERGGTKRLYEEKGIVLDYVEGWMPRRVSAKYTTSPYVQLIGDTYFTLLEAIGFKDIKLNPFDVVFIGPWPRKQISTIIGRITYNDLTPIAQDNLPKVVREIVLTNSKKFVETINNAQLLTPRLHSLELLPGIGRVTVRRILEERAKAPFTTLEDLKSRTGLQDPLKVITERILMELTGEEKYKIFVR